MVQLTEISRKSLVNKTKKQSPERYARRLNYRPLSIENLDTNALMTKDKLVVTVKVGDYDCVIAFENLLKYLKETIKLQPKPTLTLKTVVRATKKSIDYSSVHVNCSCGDFVYRFAYWATKFDYKFGKPETRPAKITNPQDSKGAICKHLASLLYNKNWLAKVASLLTTYFKDNIEQLRKVLNLSEEELYINEPNNARDTKGRFVPKQPVTKDPEPMEPEQDTENDEDLAELDEQ